MGRKKLITKGITICLLRDRDNLSLSQMGDMFGLTNSAVSRYIERYWDEYVKMKRSGTIDLIGKRKHNKK